MGLAASQARYLFLTARKSDIEYNQMQIANEKITMSRESAKIAEDYSDALNQTKLTVDTTTSGSTADVTYGTLMNYNSTISGQYIMTDINGAVVLSDDDAATIKSLTGTSGTSGSGFSLTKAMQEQYLANKMGVSDTKTLDSYISGYNTSVSSGTDTDGGTTSISKILSALSSSSFTSDNKNYDWKSLYSASDTSDQTIYLGSDSKGSDSDSMKKQLETILTGLVTKLKGTGTLDADALTTAYQNTISQFENMDSQNYRNNYIVSCAAGVNQIENFRENGSHTHNYAVNAKNLINSLFTYYQMATGTTSEDGLNNLGVGDSVKSSGSSGTNYATKITTTGTGSTSGTSGTTSSTSNQAQANFYLNQLAKIASCGWVNMSAASNKDDLQKDIKNGSIYLEKYKGGGKWGQVTTSDSSTTINEEDDTDAQTKAEAVYKTETAKLNVKESELDLKEKNLETERTEIDTEIDSVKNVISKNVERSFKMFA